jgi:hypothetical protein
MNSNRYPNLKGVIKVSQAPFNINRKTIIMKNPSREAGYRNYITPITYKKTHNLFKI